ALRGIFGEYTVSVLFAADIAAARAHFLEHIAIADRRALQSDTILRQPLLQAEVRHDRRHHRLALQLAAAGVAGGDQSHQLVAVNDAASLVDDDQPVGVAIARQAE